MRVYEARDSPEWSCAFFCLFTAQGDPPHLWCGVYVHLALQLPGPIIAPTVGWSPSSSTLFGGETLYNCVIKFVLPRMQALQ